MKPLTFSSGLSPVADPFSEQLAERLSVAIGRSVVWIDERAREGWLRNSQTNLLWACGYLHVSNLTAGSWPYQAMAAPVMSSARYGNRAVYFGDVIVRSDDPARAIQALAGRRFAFNERESFSGYQILLGFPLIGDNPDSWLAAGIRTGSHSASICAVIDGSADWAVIDSTILDMQDHPGIQTIASIGPYPSPPILISRACDDVLRKQILHALIGLHADEVARTVFDRWNVSSFVEAHDRDYLSLLSVRESELTS